MKKVVLYYFIIVSAFIAACATSRETMETSQSHSIQNIPFYPQEVNQCGPAALASVMNFRGIAVSPDEIAQEIFSERTRGTLSIDMVLYAQGKGLYVRQYHGNMIDLRKNIESGDPVIVLVDYGALFYQKNHFMVIVGYNEQNVIAHSGRNKEKLIPVHDFLGAWGKTGYWTLLIKTVSSEQ